MQALDRNRLIQNRKFLHQAVQLVAAFPRNILPHDPTDATASLIWNSAISGLESLSAKGADGNLKVGLSFKDFELVILQEDEKIHTLNMHDRSVNEGLAWLQKLFSTLGIEGDKINLQLPYEIEDYDYNQDLSPDREAVHVFSELYQLTQSILEKIVLRIDKSIDIRCWPHHFDLAILIPKEMDSHGELKKSIGVGLSPGDEGISEPYIYVNMWPEISYDLLSKHDLIHGGWNKEGWSGAVLTYSQIESKNKTQLVSQFINDSISAIEAVI